VIVYMHLLHKKPHHNLKVKLINIEFSSYKVILNYFEIFCTCYIMEFNYADY